MTPVRLRPNLFGIPFGLAGLAACWSASRALLDLPRAVPAVLWLLTALVWLVVLVPYATQVLRRGRLGSELADPTFGPFTSVPTILLMLLGGALDEWNHSGAVTAFTAGLVLTVLIGGYLSGEWILKDLRLVQWHPGYFLPTVGGGLVASTVAARLGLPRLASVMFGYGLICWLVLGSIILARLFTLPMLPLKLRPTLAIELAPPAVAGNAWFAMNGGRLDLLAAVLAGYGVLMLLVQLRLTPLYRAVPFGPGSWAFAFSYLQAVTFGLHWLDAGHVTRRGVLTWVALTLASLGVALLLTRTGIALARGTFLPRTSEQPDPDPVGDGTPALVDSR